jgi:hypothetical protein
MIGVLRALQRDERGFALVTGVMVLSVMTMLMVVTLSAGQSAFTISERGSRWNRTLVIAEAGIHDAVTRLGQDRTSISPCPLGSATAPCAMQGGGEYQVDWTFGTNGHVTIRSIGYYPTKAVAQVTREVRVNLDPRRAFTHALFSAETLELKNDQEVFGDVFATTGVVLQNSTIVCGSVTNANGDVTLGNASRVVKNYTSTTTGKTCTGKTGDVWTGGSIISNGEIEGTAKTGAPSGTLCSPTSTNYQITGGTIHGNATACGQINSTVVPPSTSSPGTYSSRPPVTNLPTYTFDPLNYPGLTCFGGPGICSPTNPSPNAVSNFSAVSRTAMSGSYAIWQTAATSSTKIDLSGLSLNGDLTIITNAPVDFGNTAGPIAAPVPATLVIISTYVPPVGTTCSSNNPAAGDCSIYGQNAVKFSAGDPTDPNDGVVGILYTPGKIAFKNSDSAAEGSMYGGAIDIKNGFNLVYNPRVERIVGFNGSLQQTLWQELAV